MICKKLKWSGREDSNLLLPGPEPWDRHFSLVCSGLLILYIVAVRLVSSISCPLLALHDRAPAWRLGCTKRAKKGNVLEQLNSLEVISPILPPSVGLSS
jgi:hypothetical protein